MLAIILSTVFASYGPGHHYKTQEEFFNPKRLERKLARQDMRKSKLDALRAKAAEDQAEVLAAEETFQRKAKRLERLQELFRMFNEHRQGMQTILAEIGLENHAEVKEAEKDVQVAQTDVAEKAAEVQAATGETMPMQEVPVAVVPQEGNTVPMLVEAPATVAATAESTPTSVESVQTTTTAEPATAPSSPVAPASLATSFAEAEPVTMTEKAGSPETTTTPEAIPASIS